MTHPYERHMGETLAERLERVRSPEFRWQLFDDLDDLDLDLDFDDESGLVMIGELLASERARMDQDGRPDV